MSKKIEEKKIAINLCNLTKSTLIRVMEFNLKKNIFIFIYICLGFSLFAVNEIDLDYEYSLEYFQKGIRAFHNTEYELAIMNFLKSLGYKENNHKARYFLGEAYRKAGYEENALFVWNSLLSIGYEDKSLKNKISYLYHKRGMLTDIYIDKDYILKEDIKGYYNDKTIPLFLKPSQITIDRNNHYYIASFLTGMVAEIDQNFKIVRNYTSPYPKIEKPFGVAVDKDGFVYISDFKNDVVLKMNKLNIIEKQIGFKGIGEGGLLGPKYLLLDDDENLYVSDSGNNRINKYKKDGEFLFSFGTEKDGDGDLKSPSGIFYDNGKIYVCDRDTNRVVVFDKSGNYLNYFGDQNLSEPYDITKDKLGRFLILCKDKLWAYEEDNSLWYIIDAIGDRLQRGTSIITDIEGNILLTDFNSGRLLALALERHRYSNLNVNIERVYSQKFKEVHFTMTIENDDGVNPTGINASNIVVYENGKIVPLIGTSFTEEKNSISDITIIYDKTKNMARVKDDIKITVDKWIKSMNKKTNVCLVSANEDNPIIENDFGSGRLSILDSFDEKSSSSYTDKGFAIKFGSYHMLNRFSKKSIILITDGGETGKDFEKFKIDDCINFANNNDIKIYVMSFGDSGFSEIYKYMAKKTGGDYYRVYKRSDLQDLFKKIENSKGREMVVSYKSRSTSRFGDEPISIYAEINYNGMKGIATSTYYPGR